MGVVADAHLVAPTPQAGKQGGVHDATGDASFPHRDVRAVPRSTVGSYLDLGPRERRRCMHDGGTDVASDVEHDGPFFTRPVQVMMSHDYDGTETGVTEGFA